MLSTLAVVTNSDPSSILVTLYYLSGLSALVVLVAVAIRLMHKTYRRSYLVHEAIIGRPAGQGTEGLPSIIERFDEVKAQLNEQDGKIASIDRELRPNGGFSVFDKIVKLETAAADVGQIAEIAKAAAGVATAAAADAARALAVTAATAAETKAVADADAARVAAKVVADAAATAAERAVEGFLARQKALGADREH